MVGKLVIEVVVEKLLGYGNPASIPRKFARWVSIYLETISIDPQLCACVNDPQCAEELDSMILELLELDDYEPRIDVEEVKELYRICRESS